LTKFTVDISAWVAVEAKDENEAWEIVNRYFSPAFYEVIKEGSFPDGEIAIEEVHDYDE
jgi:hypothetical protein